MMSEYQLKQMIFLSIQTAGISKELKGLRERMQELWVKSKGTGQEDYEQLFRDEAGLTAEFGQIIQINLGRIKENEERDGELAAKIVSVEGEEEKEILKKGVEILENITMSKLCGHGIKEFTIPFLVKRLRIQGINKIPECLAVFGKKPWELNCLDTQELWQSGARGRTSLELIAEVMGISEEGSNKESIHELFWSGNQETIREIGKWKVLTTINLVLLLNGRDKIREVEFEKR